MTTTTKIWMIDLLFIALFFAVAYGIYLGGYSLFIPDDARYVEISREMARSGDYLTPRLGGLKYFEKPPLFYWLDAIAINLGGNAVWVGRSINALFALLGCVMLYAMGRGYYDRTTGWLAAGILGSSLIYIILARYVTLDMTFTCCLTGCLGAFLYAYLLPPGWSKRLWLYAAYGFAALAVLAKGLAGIVLPLGIIGFWVLVRWDWRSLRYFYIPSGLLLFFIIVLPWHVLMQAENPEFFDYYIIFHHFFRYATLAAERYEPIWFFIPVLLVGLLPWIVFLPQSVQKISKKEWRRDPVFSFLAAWIVVIFVFFSISQSKLIPYILPIFPALALLISHYLMVCYQEKRFPMGGLSVLSMLTVVLLFAMLTAIFWFPENQQRYRDAIPYLQVIMAGYLICVAFCWWLWQKQNLLAGVATLVMGSMLSVTTAFIALEPFINAKSTQDFADYLQPILQPQDIVIAYNHFYYDLPYYLDRNMLLTRASGELKFGAEQEPNNPLLITTEQVWAMWEGPQRIFMVMRPETYAHLPQEGRKVWLLAETQRAVLISNRAK